MSDNTKSCKGCRQTKEIYKFFDNNKEIRATCKACRERTKFSKRQKREQNVAETFTTHKENAIPCQQLPDIIYKQLLIANGTEEDFLENNNFQFAIEQTLLLDSSTGSLSITSNDKVVYQKIADNIIALVSEGDGYQYIYHSKVIQKKSIAFFYWCNMRVELNKHSKKHDNISKQRDTDPRISRHKCNGYIMIKVDYENGLVFFKLNHILHSRPNHIETTNSIKQYINNNIKRSVSEIYHEIKDQQLSDYELLTKSQVYYWWNRQAILEYQRNKNENISARIFLQDKNYSIIFETTNPIESFAFITPLFSQISHNALKTVVTDATYNTNVSKYELYGIMGVIDGTAFPLSYLLVATGKNRPIIEILAGWFASLKNKGLNSVKTFLTDKDMAQINAAILVWPKACIQLCLWHLKQTVEQHLSSRKQVVQIRYNAQEAYKQCPVIDPYWQPIIFQDDKQNSFCLKHHRDIIIQQMGQHFHRHMLIPTADKEFIINPKEIWIRCVKEMFQYCYNNNLQIIWAYLWENWYSWSQFILWARCSSFDIKIHKTTMFIESHWRILKRDYLYKFSRPRLDLLCYIIVDKVVLQQLDRYHLLCFGRELPSWRKDFKAEWRKLALKTVHNWDKYITDQQKWICSCPYFLTNRFFLCKHLVVPKGRMENLFFKTVCFIFLYNNILVKVNFIKRITLSIKFVL